MDDMRPQESLDVLPCFLENFVVALLVDWTAVCSGRVGEGDG